MYIFLGIVIGVIVIAAIIKTVMLTKVFSKSNQLTNEQKIDRILLSVERLCKVIEVRCKNGEYSTLHQNYATIHECFVKLTEDKIYTHLQASHKNILTSLMYRTLVTLNKHNQFSIYNTLKEYTVNLLTRFLTEEMQKDDDEFITEMLNKIRSL